jgi:hypothetical protein
MSPAHYIFASLRQCHPWPTKRESKGKKPEAFFTFAGPKDSPCSGPVVFNSGSEKHVAQGFNLSPLVLARL